MASRRSGLHRLRWQSNEEEKLVRQTAREFVENEIVPSSKAQREATFPHASGPAAWGNSASFGARPTRTMACAGLISVAYGIKDPRTRNAAIRNPQLCLGAIRAGSCIRTTHRQRRAKSNWGGGRDGDFRKLQQGKKNRLLRSTEQQFGSNPGGISPAT